MLAGDDRVYMVDVDDDRTVAADNVRLGVFPPLDKGGASGASLNFRPVMPANHLPEAGFDLLPYSGEDKVLIRFAVANAI